MIVFHYSTIYLLTYRNGLYLHVDGISCKCDTKRAGHFTLDAHASRPVACLHILNDHEHERQFYRARYQLIHDTYFARKFVEWRIRPSSFVNEYPIAYPTVVALTKSVNQAVDEHSALGEP